MINVCELGMIISFELSKSILLKRNKAALLNETKVKSEYYVEKCKQLCSTELVLLHIIVFELPTKTSQCVQLHCREVAIWTIFQQLV